MPVNPFGFESGANGDVITNGNTGASAISLTGGTGIIATAQKRNGTRSILFTGTSTSGACYAQFDVTPTTTLALRVYVYATALPSADTTIMWVGNATSQRANVEVTST